MQKYSFLFKSQQLPLKNLTFVHFLTIVFTSAPRAQCNGGSFFLALVAFDAGNALLFSGICGIQCSTMFSSFLAFAKFGTRKGLLRYGICVPCSKRLPMYATRFQKPSVLKTGFWGTEGIFGTGNALLRYATQSSKALKTASSDTPPP